jgi:hypothetical protein
MAINFCSIIHHPSGFFLVVKVHKKLTSIIHHPSRNSLSIYFAHLWAIWWRFWKADFRRTPAKRKTCGKVPKTSKN